MGAIKYLFSVQMRSLASYGTCSAEDIVNRNHRREKEYTLVLDVKASEGLRFLQPCASGCLSYSSLDCPWWGGVHIYICGAYDILGFSKKKTPTNQKKTPYMKGIAYIYEKN